MRAAAKARITPRGGVGWVHTARQLERSYERSIRDKEWKGGRCLPSVAPAMDASRSQLGHREDGPEGVAKPQPLSEQAACRHRARPPFPPRTARRRPPAHALRSSITHQGGQASGNEHKRHIYICCNRMGREPDIFSEHALALFDLPTAYYSLCDNSGHAVTRPPCPCLLLFQPSVFSRA